MGKEMQKVVQFFVSLYLNMKEGDVEETNFTLFQI